MPLGHEIIPQGDLQIPEADEPFNTFLENALHKAVHLRSDDPRAFQPCQSAFHIFLQAFDLPTEFFL